MEHYASLSDRLVKATRNLRLLKNLSWPAAVRQRFLSDWRQGDVRFPEVVYPRLDVSAEVDELHALLTALGNDDPLAGYLAQTTASYLRTAYILQTMGRPELSRHSIELYGQPGEPIPGTAAAISNLHAAEYFANMASSCQTCAMDDVPAVDATTVQVELQRAISSVLAADSPVVELDSDLVSKAAAGATRIRLRTCADFYPNDIQQLLQHEAFVHSLTAINGRQQTYLKILGRSAPRTTGTQEGLATFAELVTGAIDLPRLKRISLRIIAIDMALRGADFIEVFRFFLEQGQTESESFNSAMRVFRGVPLAGGSAFTKDTVYLHGLLSVHTFFRWCLANDRLDRCYHLFAGRLTVSDVISLEPLFEQSLISAPRYLPPWMEDRNSLAAYLAFSVFANQINLHQNIGDDLAQDAIIAPRLLDTSTAV